MASQLLCFEPLTAHQLEAGQGITAVKKHLARMWGAGDQTNMGRSIPAPQAPVGRKKQFDCLSHFFRDGVRRGANSICVDGSKSAVMPRAQPKCNKQKRGKGLQLDAAQMLLQQDYDQEGVRVYDGPLTDKDLDAEGLGRAFYLDGPAGSGSLSLVSSCCTYCTGGAVWAGYSDQDAEQSAKVLSLSLDLDL